MAVLHRNWFKKMLKSRNALTPQQWAIECDHVVP